MSYHLRRRSPLADVYQHRPRGGLAGITSQPAIIPRQYRMPTSSLGSLGDAPDGNTTLSTPTIPDPATAQWQASVLAQLKAGVDTMRTAELQKWLQIVATVSIPLSAAIWKMIFKKGVTDPTT